MAFSWKKAKRNSIDACTRRIQQYQKLGKNALAQKLKDKRDRLRKDENST